MLTGWEMKILTILSVGAAAGLCWSASVALALEEEQKEITTLTERELDRLLVELYGKKETDLANYTGLTGRVIKYLPAILEEITPLMAECDSAIEDYMYFFGESDDKFLVSVGPRYLPTIPVIREDGYQERSIGIAVDSIQAADCRFKLEVLKSDGSIKLSANLP